MVFSCFKGDGLIGLFENTVLIYFKVKINSYSNKTRNYELPSHEF